MYCLDAARSKRYSVVTTVTVFTWARTDEENHERPPPPLVGLRFRFAPCPPLPPRPLPAAPSPELELLLSSAQETAPLAGNCGISPTRIPYAPLPSVHASNSRGPPSLTTSLLSSSSPLSQLLVLLLLSPPPPVHSTTLVLDAPESPRELPSSPSLSPTWWWR